MLACVGAWVRACVRVLEQTVAVELAGVFEDLVVPGVHSGSCDMLVTIAHECAITNVVP